MREKSAWRVGLVVAAAGLVGIHAAAGQPGERGGRRERGERPAAEAAPSTQPISSATKSDSSAKAAGDADLSTTHHTITIGGQVLHYQATAGYMTLPDYDGKPKANIFFVAYTKENAPPPPPPAPAPGGDATTPPAPQPEAAATPPAIDAATRPITFAFNGGPGSSSVWLHLGALGPKRVIQEEKDVAPPVVPAPPYQLVDNEYTWMTFTDLVFIDPVSTGYSRPVEGESASQFHGLEEDLRSVGEFIRLWTTKNKRWGSPKFLAGESYGTTRCAGLSGTLQDTHGMYLNGIVLISTVLNFQTLQFNTGNDVPYPLFLPTYTATAWYHKKLAPDLQADFAKTIGEAKAWALGDYTTALAKGDALTPVERAEVVTRLSRYTGLSERYIEDCNLRPRIFNFTKELLRDQDKTVGRLDSRYVGVDGDSVGASSEFDPSMSAITGPYTACLNDYVRTELKYENDKNYEILTGRVQPWSYAGSQNRYVNVAETLRSAIAKNNALKVMVAAGYYDLATPFFAADYTMNHLGLPPALQGNVETHYYDAGHMMYIRLADLEKLTRDVGAFYGKAAAKN
jgi:carboxypeptidase C (cathepsin A)